MMFVPQPRPSRSSLGFTLAEVVVCMAIVVLVFGGLISGYIQNAYRAEWAGFNLAAQAQAMQGVEQAKSAKWDSTANEFTNLVLVTANILDLPISGTNITWATNYSTVRLVTNSTVPLVTVYMVKVDTKWPFKNKGVTTFYTNTVASYYAQDSW